MSKLFISSKFSTLRNKVDKNSFALVDKVDIDIPDYFKNRVFIISDLEQEMFEDREYEATLNKQIIEWIKSWPNEPVLDGKSLKELLKYKETSLWWFGETNFLRTSHGKHVISLKETIIRLEAIKYGIEKIKPGQIYIDNSNDLTGKCSTAISITLDIPIIYRTPNKISKEPGLNSIYFIVARKIKQTRNILRSIIARTNRGRFGLSNGTNQIMVFSLQRFIETTELETVESKLPKDIRLFPLFDAIESKYKKLPRVMYSDSSYPIGLDTVRKLKAPAYPMDLYWPIFDKEQSDFHGKIKKIWKKLAKSNEFKKSLNYKGINMWPLLCDNFAFLFIKQYPEAIESIRTMENAVNLEKPKLALIINETGFYGRSLMVACKNQGIKTIGLQHGGISHLEVEYYHRGEGDKLMCPISDMMAVIGTKDKERLLGYGLYNEDNVIVTGSPKYDILFQAKKNYLREDLLKRYGIKKDKIVVITTMRFPILEDREDWLRAVLTASKEIKNAFFIIKPHPGEVNLDIHNRLCKELMHGNAIVADRTAETNELMANADLTINAGSTTGLESLMLGTPLLVVLLPGIGTKASSLEHGAAIGTYKEEEILPAMRKMLDGDLPLSIKNNIQEYIQSYAFKIDGKSSERIVDIIGEYVQK